MYRIKSKKFENTYLGKIGNLKRGKLVLIGNAFKTKSLEEITKFYHASDKGSLKGTLIIESF